VVVRTNGTTESEITFTTHSPPMLSNVSDTSATRRRTAELTPPLLKVLLSSDGASPTSPVEKVLTPPQVYQVCLSHAMSTEKEEVMALLLGEWFAPSVAHIYGLCPLRLLA
jgi:hypothetical protein